MSLVKKIKDILFEEEPTEQIKIVKETPTERIKEAVTVREYHEPKESFSEPVVESRPRIEPKEDFTPKREPVVDNTFKFPDFDEEEFISSMPWRQSTNNVLDYERKKVQDNRSTYKDERAERNEPKELIDKKKLK